MTRRKSRGPNFRGKIRKNAQRQKKEGRSYGYLSLPKNVNTFKEEVTSGKNRIKLDILPYLVTMSHHPDKEDGAKKGEYWYRRPYWVHHQVGVENKSMVCPKTFGKPCPICEYRQKQLGNPDIKKKDIISKPQLKNLYAVIVLNHKDYDKDTIYIWDIAQGNFQSTLNDELEENSDYEIFPSLDEGLTLSIRFNEEVYNRTKYPEAKRIDFDERDYSYPETILDEVPKLDEVLKVLSYKEIEAEFLDLEDEDEDMEGEKNNEPNDEDEDQEEGQSSQRRKTISRVSKEQNEPDEEPDKESSPTLSRSRSKSTTPTKRRRRKEEPGIKPETENECPKGYEFGKDWDDFDDCDGCELFEQCGEKYEQMNK